MDAMIWKPVGPLTPRPMERLTYPTIGKLPQGWRTVYRAGYSVAEVIDPSAPGRKFLGHKFAPWDRRGEEHWHRPLNREHFLEIQDIDSSQIIDRATGVSWFDVRLIPPIYAPNVHEFVGDDGLTFYEAFQRMVLSCEEVAFTFGRDTQLFGQSFWNRHLFGPDQVLKIADTSSLDRVCTSQLNAAFRAPDEEKERRDLYCFLIGKKAERLLRLLAAGHILSYGFYRSDARQRIAIDPTLWARPEYAIDLRKSDLVNVETGEAEWSATKLRAPQIDVKDEPLSPIDGARPMIADDGAQSRVGRATPKTQRSIEAEKLIAEAFPNGVPSYSDMTDSEVVRKVMKLPRYKILETAGSNPKKDTILRQAGRRNR